MSDETKQPDEKAAEAKPAKAPKRALVKMKHAIEWTGELVVDRHVYPVTDGVVEVPVEHIPHAEQSGFRPA